MGRDRKFDPGIPEDLLRKLGQLGNELFLLRAKRGLTTAQVARMVGIGAATYRAYESGDRCPSEGTCLRLSQVLQCDAVWLMAYLDDWSEAHRTQNSDGPPAPSTEGMEATASDQDAEGGETLDPDLPGQASTGETE